jgi:hypothetical protein
MTRSCRKKIKMETRIRRKEGEDKIEEIKGKELNKENFGRPFCRLCI